MSPQQLFSVIVRSIGLWKFVSVLPELLAFGWATGVEKTHEQHLFQTSMGLHYFVQAVIALALLFAADRIAAIAQPTRPPADVADG